MKGLLHRLAARAVGRAVPVRADARLSFGAAGLDWADAGEQAPSVGRPAVGEREQGRRDSEPVTQPRGDAAPAAPDLFEPRQARPLEPPLVRGASAQIPPSAPGQGAPRETLEVSAEGAGFVTTLLVASSSDSPDTVVPRPSSESRDTARNLPGLALPPALRPAAPPAQSNAAFSVPPVSHSPPAAARQGSAGAGDDRTEVHIHIGRIDVTALPDAPQRRAPAAAAPAATAATAPMSLDAYLARRSRS
jgi:hypothetical protein